MHISATTLLQPMTQNNTTMTEQEQPHTAVDLETIVVDPDDVVTTMKRNERDAPWPRSHVLRITPPFEGEQTAKPHVDEEQTYYPPELDPKPLHVDAKTFLTGHSNPDYPAYPEECVYPSHHDSRGRFYDHYDLCDEHGDRPSELTDEQEQMWDEWWETELEVWEDHVRHHLKDSITLSSQHPSVQETTVQVRYE